MTATAASSAGSGSPERASAESLKRAPRLSAQITEELPHLRTRFSRTYATRRGGRVARVFAGPVNYRADGTWRAIDNRLDRTRDGDLENRANRYRVELPAQLDEKPVVVRNAGERLGFELMGADDAPARAAGAHAIYADALPGVDIRYDALADAVKETLILESADAPREYRFKLALSNGLKARLTRAGELEVVGPDGNARFVVPAPVAWQHGDEHQPSGDHVRFAYDAEDQVLELRVDDAWLSAPGRRFPVSIDPWVAFPAEEGDCTLSSEQGEQSTTDCTSTDLRAGNVEGSTYSSVLDLGLAERLPEWITVIEGYAGVYLKSAGGSDWQEFTLSALTRPFVDGEASWTNAASGTPWSNPGGDFSTTPAMTHWMGPGVDAPAWTFWAMPDQIQRWADGTDPDHGLVLHATSAEPVFGATFSSTDESDSSHRPYVEVYYEPIHGEDGDFSFVEEDLPGIRSRVNLATGRLTVHDTDREVTEDGPGFALDRFYNSADVRWGSPLETGWKLGAAPSAYRSGNGDVSVEMPSGTVLRFAWDADTQSYRPDRYDNAALTESSTELVVERGEGGERFVFDRDSGRLTKRERNGETGEATYAYDSSGRLSTITAPGNQVTTLHYDGDGRLTSADLPGGDTVSYTFTGDRLTGRTADGQTTSYGYTDGRLSHLESPQGRVAFRYDAAGRVTHLIQVTDIQNDTGPTTTFAYHDATQLGDCPSGSAGRTVETRPDSTTVTHCSDPSAVVHQTGAGTSPPEMLEEPQVDGGSTPYVGETLTYNVGLWDGSQPMDLVFRWLVCESEDDCTPIEGSEDLSELDLTEEHVGQRLAVEGTATNAYGSRTARSPLTEVIAVATPEQLPANTEPPGVTGDGVLGQQLRLMIGTWERADSVQMEWLRCTRSDTDCERVYGLGDRYAIEADDVGKRIYWSERGVNQYGSTTARSQPVDVLGPPPVNQSLPEISGTVRDGSTLHASTGAWSGGTALTYTYQWFRCERLTPCTEVQGATNADYELTGRDLDRELFVEVRATTEDGGTAAATSANTPTVAPLQPSGTRDPALTGDPRDGATLRVDAGAWNGSRPMEITRRWQRCAADGSGCTDIAGATDQEYRLETDDIGQRLRVTVTATNAAGTAEQTSGMTEPVTGVAPENTDAPRIAGSPSEGRLLTVDTGEWTGTAPLTTAVRWQRCAADGSGCSDVAGATERRHRLGAADVGSRLRAIVSVTNPTGTATETTSTTAVVSEGRPVLLDAPGFAGEVRDGEQLSAHPGAWAGTGPIAHTYQWQRCERGGTGCADIPGADSAEHEVDLQDAIGSLRVRVTATSSVGSTSAYSDARDGTIGPAPVAVSGPTIEGTPLEGRTLTAHAGEWHGELEIDLAYRWDRCGETGCAPIDGETGPSHRLTREDVGAALRVVVTATTATGSATARSAPTATVRSARPLVALPLDEGLGDLAHDVSGAGRNAALAGASWLAGGRHGGALSLDGSDDALEITADNALDAGGHLTAETWLRPRRPLGDWSSVLAKRGDSGPAWRLRGGLGGILVGQVGDLTVRGPVVAVDRWTHVALTYDGAMARLYVDGEQVAEAGAADALPGATGGALMLGGEPDLAGRAYDGALDEVRIYNSARTASQIAADMQRALDPSAAARPLVALGFEEGRGTTAHDSSGWGHPALMTRAGWSQEGVLGAAMSLEQDGAMAVVPADPFLEVDDAATFQVAVKPTADRLWQPLVAQQASDGTPVTMWARDGDGRVAVERDGLSLIGPVLPQDRYSVVAYIEDGVHARLFVDGEQVAQADVQEPLRLRGALRLGATGQPGEQLDGEVDELRLYDRVLDADELELDDMDSIVSEQEELRPTLQLTGTAIDLQDAPTEWMESPRILTVRATEPGANGRWTPGVTQLELLLDGQPLDGDSVTCPRGGCALQRQFEINVSTLSAGEHELEVIARDGLDRATTQTLRIEATEFSGPDAPVGLYSRRGSGFVELSWTDPPHPGIDDHNIYRRNANGWWDFAQIDAAPIETSEYRDETVDNLTDYAYNVTAGAGNLLGDWSETSTVPASTTSLQAPPAVTATPGAGSVELSWQAVDGADGYLVFRAHDPDGPWTRLTDTALNTTAFVDDEPLEYGTYAVRSVAASTMSARSAPVDVEPLPPVEEQPTVELSGTLVEHQYDELDDGSYTVHVDATAPADAAIAKTELLVDGEPTASDATGCATAGCTAGTDFTFLPAEQDDGSHLIEIVATDTEGRATLRSLSVMVEHGAPSPATGLRAIPHSDSIALDWEPAADRDVDGYHVYRTELPGGAATRVTAEAIPGERFEDHDVETGQSYRYTVRAVDASGQEGSDSDPTDATMAGAATASPTGLVADADEDTVQLEWNATGASDLAGYDVFRAVGQDGEFRKLNEGVVTTPRYLDQNPIQADLRYEVRNVSEAGATSAPSTEVGARPTGPPATPSSRDYVYLWRSQIHEVNEPIWHTDGWGGFWSDNYVSRADSTDVRHTAANGAETTICDGRCSHSDRTDGRDHRSGAPSLSPDGTHVVFSHTRSESNENAVITISGADGSDSRLICGQPGDAAPLCLDRWPRTLGGARDATFTHDGNRVLYVAEDALYSIALDGTDRRRLLTLPGKEVRHPVESADGRSLYFSVLGDIWSADGEGSNPRRLDIGEGSAETPRPSPDGTKLVWVEGGELRLASFDGTDSRVLAHNAAWPSWSPDGRSILLEAPRPVQGGGEQTHGPGIVTLDIMSGAITPLIEPHADATGITAHPTAPAYRTASQPTVTSPDLPNPVNYDAGTGSLSVRALGTDPSGVKQLGWAIARARDTELAACASGCPESVRETLSVDVSVLPEGRHVARLSATNPSGARAEQRRSLVIDRSQPGVPTEVAAVASTAGDAITLEWTIGVDPALADGSAGSGVAATRYRYRTVAGEWSQWYATTRRSAAIPRTELSETAPAVQVASVDRAGNLSSTEELTADQMCTGPEPCDVRIAMSAFDADLPDYRVPVAHAAGPTARASRVYMKCNVGKTTPTRGGTRPSLLEEYHGEMDIAVRGETSAYCVPNNPANPEDVALTAITTLDYQSCLQASRNGVNFTTVKCERDEELATDPTRRIWLQVTQLCSPGSRYYRLRAKWRIDNGSPAGWSHWFTEAGPTTRKRKNCNEAGAWRRKATSGPSPSTLLGAKLRDPNSLYREPLPPGDGVGPLGGWEAHHIVPADVGKGTKSIDFKANAAQALAYSCYIDPNQAINGVWLRGPRLRTSQPGYSELEPEDRIRPYHRSIHTTSYYAKLREHLSRHGNSPGDCDSVGSMVDELQELRRLIRSDSLYDE